MDKVLRAIERSFAVSKSDMQKIVKGFHSEMGKGLSGKAGSLKMIPTYVARPTGKEKGIFLAIDLGGTNFRVLELELKGSGRVLTPNIMKFALEKRYTTGTAEEFFDFIADCLKEAIKKYRVGCEEELDLGFTFSFPVKQTGLAGGTLAYWTKGFDVKGVVGQDVVALLGEAIARKGMDNVKVAALANDTVGTLVARSYGDRSCDVGVIIGTGTNACYPEKMANIRKWHGPRTSTGEMIVNIEWGNFNRLKITPYDRYLDKASKNPGRQILEKMVSGRYLGEVARLVLKDLIGKKLLFNGRSSGAFCEPGGIKAEDVSGIEGDKSPGLSKITALLGRFGISGPSFTDRMLVRKICGVISGRAARISAAAIAAVVTKMDHGVSRRHTIAIDGSVYEKHPGFSAHMESALKELLGKKASKIRMVLAKDGSGKGAAIIAAIAARI